MVGSKQFSSRLHLDQVLLWLECGVEAADRSGTFGIWRSYLPMSGSGPCRSCTSLSERYKVPVRIDSQPVVFLLPLFGGMAEVK